MRPITYIIWIAIAASTLSLLNACEDDPVVQETVAESQLSIQINHKVNDQGLVLGRFYTDRFGRTYEYSAVRYYLCNIKLIKADSSEVSFDDHFLLVKPEIFGRNQFNLGILPAGNYIGMRFNVGIDAFTNNSTDPENDGLASTNPLALQSDVPMWWNRMRGYKFLVLEGKYDTSMVTTNIPAFDFRFYIGTDDYLRSVTLWRTFKVQQGVTVGLNLDFDLAELFEDINLAFENQTQSFDNTFVADKVANRIPFAFSFSQNN